MPRMLKPGGPSGGGPPPDPPSAPSPVDEAVEQRKTRRIVDISSKTVQIRGKDGREIIEVGAISFQGEGVEDPVYDPIEKMIVIQIPGGPAVNYAERRETATGSITYEGWADPGSLTSAAVWRVSRIVESGHPEFVRTWADGDNLFNNIWDDRATLSYS